MHEEVVMFWLLVTALWAAMLLSPFLLLFLFLPPGRDCPRCAAETLPIRSRLLKPIRRMVTVRWCIACGWEGVARAELANNPLPRFEVVPDDGSEDERASWQG
jgi:hypothetical protein